MSAEFGAQGPVGCSVDVCNWMNVYNQLLDGFKQEVVAGGGALDEETIKDVKQKASREFMLGWYVPDVKSITREWSQAEVVESDVVYVKSEFGYQIQRKDTGEVVGDADEVFIEKRQKLGTEDAEESLTLRKAFAEIEKSGEVYFPVHNQTEGKDAVRYVAHWVKEGDVIKPEMLRIARDGNDKSLPEVHKMLANTLGLDGYKEVRQSERAFIYVKLSGELSERISVTKVKVEPDGQQEVINKVKDIDYGVVVGVNVVGKENVGEELESITAVTKREVAIYTGTRKKKEVEQGTGINRPRVDKSDQFEEVKKEAGEVKVANERLTVERIKEQPMDLRREIDNFYQEMSGKIISLRVITETKVAVGAIPIFLASLSERPRGRLKAVDKSFRRQREKLKRVKRRNAVSGKVEINLLFKKSKDSFDQGNLIKSDRVIFVRNLARRNKRRQEGLTETGVGGKLKRKKLLAPDNEFKKKKVRHGNEWRRRKKSEKRRLNKITKGKEENKLQGIILRRRKTKESFARGEVSKKKMLMIEDNKSLIVESRVDGDKCEKSDGEMRVSERKMKRLEHVVRRLLYRHQKYSREIDRFIRPEIKQIKINLEVGKERRRQEKGRELVIKKDKRQRSKEVAAGLGLSWAIWLLISRQQVREMRVIREVSKLKSGVKEKESREVFHPWLILAIIYYLAMVREQGVKQVSSSWLVARSYKVKYNKNKPRGRKVNLSDNEFPRAGIIFAALS